MTKNIRQNRGRRWARLAAAVCLSGVIPACEDIGLPLGPNQAPMATHVNVETTSGRPVTVTLAGTDANGDALEFTIWQSPVRGSLSEVTAMGSRGASVTYTPNGDFTGTDQFQFRAHDGQTFATGTVTITVTNDAPVANTVIVRSGQTGSVEVVLAGSDPDDDPLTFEIVSQPILGTLGKMVQEGDSRVRVEYTINEPLPLMREPDVIVYRVSDGSKVSESATATVVFNQLPSLPGAGLPAEVETAGRTPMEVQLSGEDPEGDPLSVEIVSGPAHGTLSEAGAFRGSESSTAEKKVSRTYSPEDEFAGEDSFTFILTDGFDVTGEIEVTVSVGDQGPMVMERQVEVEGAGASTTVTLVGADPNGDPLTFSIMEGPTQGRLGEIRPIDGWSAEVTYTAGARATGMDRFRYTAMANGLMAEPAEVRAVILNGPPGEILLMGNSVAENEPPGTGVGVLSAVDPDPEDTHTYRLVPGEGDTHNAQFQIVGNVLRTSMPLDYEAGAARTIRVEADDGSGGTVEGVLQVTVLDRQVMLTVTDVTKAEGDAGTTAFIFEVTLDEDIFGGFVVDAGTKDGTATEGADYTQVTQTLTFDGVAGEVRQVTVQVMGDMAVEGDETFALALGDLFGVDLADVDIETMGTGIGTIEESDSAALTVSDVTLDEGDGGTTAFTFDVTLDNTVQGGFTVDASTGAGTADPLADHATVNQTLVFDGLANEVQQVTVQVVGDMVVEDDETFSVTLSDLQRADPTEVDITTMGTGTIENDDTATLTVSDVTVEEGDGGTTAFIFDVTLDNAVQGGFTVDVGTVAGTAASPADYTAIVEQTLTFAGDADEVQQVTVQVRGDTVMEGDETFTVTLSNLQGADPASVDIATLGTGTIQDDDVATFTVSDFTRVEGDQGVNTFVFDVTLDKAVPVPGGFMAVRVNTIDGTAEDENGDGDYTAVVDRWVGFSGTANEVQQVTVQVTTDIRVEEDETFSLTIDDLFGVDPALVDITAMGTGTGTIENDDQMIGPKIYAVEFGSNGRLHVVGTATNTAAKWIPVRSGPIQLAITPDGSRVYVANLQSNDISVIDVARDELVPMLPIPVGMGPIAIAIRPDGSRAYVSNFDSGSISVIDLATNTAVNTIAVGTAVQGLVFTPDGSRAYVAAPDLNSVIVIDAATETVVGSPIPLGARVVQLAITPDGSRIYTTNPFSDNTSVIDVATNTVVATIPLGGVSGSQALAFTPAGSRAYVVNFLSDNVSVIDVATNTIVDTIAVPGNPAGIVITADGSRAYVGRFSSTRMAVIDLTTNTIVDEFQVSAFLQGMVIEPGGT